MITTNVYYAGCSEDIFTQFSIETLEYIYSELQNGTFFNQLLQNVFATQEELNRGTKLEELNRKHCNVLDLLSLISRNPPSGCRRSSGDNFVNSIRAFHQNKYVILGIGEKITETIDHMTTNIFLKNDSQNGGCIFNFDSLFKPTSSTIKTTLINTLALFYKYRHIVELLDSHKTEIAKHFAANDR